MAASSPSPDMGDTLDELTCHVCFELYKEPITLPCSHTFCRVCIEKCWENRGKGTDCVCPNCHEVFQQKPKFKKNVIIANFVEKIKLKKTEVGFGVGVQDAEHGGVKSGGTTSHCELCHESAAKRCVPCEILCCEQHLKPHQQKGHRLMDPGVKIEELRCNKHRKPIQFYCKDDGSLMCLKCTDGQHQDHIVVPVEIAHTELKDFLAAKCSHVSQSMQSLESQVLQVQEEKKQTEQSGRDAEDMLEEKRRRVCQLVNESVDLMKSQINKRKMEKLSLLEKQREKLEQQMEALRQGKSAMETALQDLEAISFLRSSKDLLKRLETMSDFNSMKTTPITVLDFSKEEKNLDGLIKFNKNFLEKIQKWLEEHLLMVEVNPNNLRSLFGRNLSLDQNSANPWIMISKDLRTATLTETKQPYQEHPDRFDCYPQVLSSESFSSGCHYWEVDVSLSRLCRIGISLNPMGRKGRKKECGLGRNPQSWCLWKYNNKYTALHNNEETPLPMSGDPKRFGFFLDCEAGELTCFGDSRVLHMFRGNFTDPVKPAIGVYDVHNSVSFCWF